MPQASKGFPRGRLWGTHVLVTWLTSGPCKNHENHPAIRTNNIPKRKKNFINIQRGKSYIWFYFRNTPAWVIIINSKNFTDTVTPFRFSNALRTMGYKVLGNHQDVKAIKEAEWLTVVFLSTLPLFLFTTNHVLRNHWLSCVLHTLRKQNKLTHLLIMSSNFARSVCGNAGSSSSSCGGASPWPCSSGGVAGEFSLEESGDEVLKIRYSRFRFLYHTYI